MAETAITSGSGAADKETTTQKKIAGKYDSVENAIESIDGAMTSNFHETREELGAVRQLLERALTPVGTRGREDDGYERGHRAEEDDGLDPTTFLTSPGKIIKEREARLEAKLRKEYDVRTANQIAAATTVLRFQMKNADLDNHEALVANFMKETNPNDPLNKRLDAAAKRTRAYLKSIKDEGKSDEDAGETTDGDEVVEEPTGRRSAAPVKPGDEDEEASRDKILANEIADQKKLRSTRFRAPEAKK